MTVKTDLENLFLRKKPVKLLMALKNAGDGKYISLLSKETDCTYSHTVKLLDGLNKMGLVKFDKKGRIKYVALTEEGDKIAAAFENVLRNFTKYVKG